MDRISIEQFAILTESIPTNEINLGTQIDFKWSIEKKKIASVAKFVFVSSEVPILKLDVLCSFKIEESDWDRQKGENGSITLPKGFLCHIAMHTVGTARGILHCKTESTPFNCFIIPPINLEQIIQEDIVAPVVK